ncbi:hypothetical protein [Mucilaginibacter sp.]|uniref:hypothetical protein n=1 Tax=Mucilaginibacter sp. TaxID=1882438 RepID=UPI0028493D6A|nr:hypothetical protein [Mucilaginibacter sp.]MDR3695593.1 hypothetical protein [Mucilaginibacter sp.]
MKESKLIGEIIKEHYPITKKHHRQKRWKIAQSRTTETHKYQRMRNEATESDYHKIIAAIKTLYLKPGEIYFERDYKNEESENFMTMHCFMSATCYLYLECDILYDFQVEYAFNNCPFEAAIREMLKPHPFDTRATEKQLQPNFNTSFQRTLKFQEPQFIKNLNII